MKKDAPVTAEDDIEWLIYAEHGEFNDRCMRIGKAFRDALAERDAALKALAELVACKALKDRIDAIVDSEECNIADNPAFQEWKELNIEYARRKPLAWEAARHIAPIWACYVGTGSRPSCETWCGNSHCLASQKAPPKLSTWGLEDEDRASFLGPDK